MKHFLKNITFLFLIVFCMTILNRCEKNNEQLPDNKTATMSAVIGQGVLSGSGDEGFCKQFSVIKTEDEWKNLKTKLNSFNNVTDAFTETHIDFSMYQLVFIIDEIKGNGGWTVDITDITENSDEIVVTVSNLKTSDGSNTVTQPFQVMKIPVSDKPVVFKDLTEEIGFVPYAVCDYDGNYIRTVSVACDAYLFKNSVPEIFMKKIREERYPTGYVAWIVYFPDKDSATLYALSQEETNTSHFCNYPYFAKQWEIPENGLNVYCEGTAFEVGSYWSAPPHVGYNMVLTILKKR